MGVQSQVANLTNIAEISCVEIELDVNAILKHDLCHDFIPNITCKDCEKTLFAPSISVGFIVIDNQTMILMPTENDLSCSKKYTYMPCFAKTYQFKLSAFNISDDSLIMEKDFTVVVKSMSKEDIETFIIMASLTGSFLTCSASICIQKLYNILRRAVLQGTS